jgi:hypothetical protein
VPCLTAAFMALQFVLKLAPVTPGCESWGGLQPFIDFAYQAGSASVYCIRDLKDGTPWIYPPAQTYFYLACVVACGYLTYAIARDWPQYRALRT